jgi:quercetin dioxygenase-like cupin family protein
MATMDLAAFARNLIDGEDGDAHRAGMRVLSPTLVGTEVLTPVGAERHARRADPIARDPREHSDQARRIRRELHLGRNQQNEAGGGRGIRTPGGVSPTAVFKTAAFDRSAIPPRWLPASYYHAAAGGSTRRCAGPPRDDRRRERGPDIPLPRTRGATSRAQACKGLLCSTTAGLVREAIEPALGPPGDPTLDGPRVRAVLLPRILRPMATPLTFPLALLLLSAVPLAVPTQGSPPPGSLAGTSGAVPRLVGAPPESAQPSTPPPGITRTVLADNASMLVARLRFAPGAREELHTHPFSAVVIHLTPAVVDMQLGAQRTTTRREAGFTEYIPRETPHAAANAGQEAFDIVTIAFKPERFRAPAGPPTPAPPGITRTPVLDNDDARIARVEFAPGAAESVHSHPVDLVVVLLTPGRLAVQQGPDKTVRAYAAGDVIVLPREVPHAVANAEAHPVTLMSVTFK